MRRLDDLMDERDLPHAVVKQRPLRATPSCWPGHPCNRIQFDFEFEGVRYRPTIERIPSEGNLRRAAKQLEDIKARIAHGTFNFAEEFPDYRGLPKVAATTGALTCNDVFDDFLQHCESRLGKSDLAFIPSMVIDGS